MATHTSWTAENIPSQHGKIILITGANSGLGLQATRVLAGKGAHVVLAVRNAQKGQEAAAGIRQAHPAARLDVLALDLADFASIRAFAAEFRNRYDRLDVLVNNAGVMAPPQRELTKQGFELQFGTNHLGHFLLTGLLLDRLTHTPGSRVAVQSSLVHKQKQFKPAIRFDDLNWEHGYEKDPAYGQSKLANLLFAYELDRRFKHHGCSTIVTAAHPGYTNTNLQKNYGFFVSVIVNNLVAMNVADGTLPILRAATEPNLRGGEFFGPTKLGELRGKPELVLSSDQSYDPALARRLWEVSEQLTGCAYTF